MGLECWIRVLEVQLVAIRHQVAIIIVVIVKQVIVDLMLAIIKQAMKVKYKFIAFEGFEYCFYLGFL